jgi:hypothetical protein
MKSIGSDSEIPPSPYVGTIMGSIAEEGVDENIDLIGLSGFAAYCSTMTATAMTATTAAWTRTPTATITRTSTPTPTTTNNPTPTFTPTTTATANSTPSPSPTHDPNRFYASAGRFSMMLPTGWNIVELQEFDDIGFANQTDYHIWYGAFEK